jgi:hypothetical protein
MPTYRRPLNEQQRDILALLARFRFGTSALLSSSFSTSQRYTHERLRILVEQEYIGKRYDNSYKLAGRPAEYYLLPKGIAVLEENGMVSPKLLKLLAKDVNASERFIRHCLSVFAASMQLKILYGSSLQFRTRSDYAGNTLFPQPLPDGYAFTEDPKTEERTHYFIECFDGTMPESVMRATITKHIEFYDNDNWEPNTPYPTIVLICRDERLKTKVDKWVQKAVAEGWSDDLQFELLLVTP